MTRTKAKLWRRNTKKKSGCEEHIMRHTGFAKSVHGLMENTEITYGDECKTTRNQVVICIR